MIVFGCCLTHSGFDGRGGVLGTCTYVYAMHIQYILMDRNLSQLWSTALPSFFTRVSDVLFLFWQIFLSMWFVLLYFLVPDTAIFQKDQYVRRYSALKNSFSSLWSFPVDTLSSPTSHSVSVSKKTVVLTKLTMLSSASWLMMRTPPVPNRCLSVPQWTAGRWFSHQNHSR